MEYDLKTMQVTVTVQTQFQPTSKKMIVSGFIKFDNDIVFKCDYNAELYENKSIAYTDFERRLHEKAALLLMNLYKTIQPCK